MRLKREAYAMGRAQGTAATEVYECETTPNGQLYLAMEFLDGQGLDAYIDGIEARGERVPVASMLKILTPVAYTLTVAHGRGIIHRDLKPQNIFVKSNGEVRLVDFGLMKDLNLTQLTAAGVVAGSPGYIAPEAWSGQPEKLDHRIDVYSMGVLVYRMLAGVKPFEMDGAILDFIIRVTKSPRPLLRKARPDLPAAIEPWTAKALAAQPEDRFQSVAELWQTLNTILA